MKTKAIQAKEVELWEQALTNSLRYYKIPEKYFIMHTWAGREYKFLIVSRHEHGYNEHSNLLTYMEMNAYIMGYADGQKNNLS